MVTAAKSRRITGKITPSLKHRSEVIGEAVLRAAAVLGIEPPHLAKVLSISTSSIARLSRGAYSLKETQMSWELAVLMVRLYQALDTIMAGDEIAMRSWMWSPNNALYGVPAEQIVTAQGLVDVVGYVESFRARV